MKNGYVILSRHFLRRTARMRQNRYERAFEEGGQAGEWIRVIKATRGPYRWYVVRMNESSSGE